MRAVLPLLLLTLSVPAADNPPATKAPESLPAPENLLLEPPPGFVTPLPPGATDAPAPAPGGGAPPAAPAPASPKVSAPTAKRPTSDSSTLPPGPVPMVNLGPQDKTGRTFSDESPFVVWGGTREQRARLFTTADMVRRDVLDALHLGQAWHNPIVIQLREAFAKGADQRPPVWTTVSQVTGGFRIEINLVPRQQSVPGALLRENIVRATLADLVLDGHGNDDLSGQNSPPPDWLLSGTLALMDYRELGRMSSTFSTIFHLGRVLSISEILGADPHGMDSVNLTIYRVSCCGLLMMLIDQPNGPAHLEKLLPGLATAGDDPSPLIERTFPALSSSSNGLSKWWSLQIAALSQPGLDEVQSPAETEQLLAEALTLHYTLKPQEKKPGALKRLFTRNKNTAPDKAGSNSNTAAGAGGNEPGKTGASSANAPAPLPAASAPALDQSCDIQEFSKVMELPDHEAVLGKPDLDLTLLLLRAHPIYRPIIAEYQTAIRNIAKDKKIKESAATLQRLAATRVKLAATLRDIEVQLDDYEARKSEDKSGAFDDYLRAAQDLDKPADPRPDPISRYLDAIEAEITE